MKAQECRPGGRHVANERGAFLKPAPGQAKQVSPSAVQSPETPEIPTFSCRSFVFGRCAVPRFPLEDIVRWIHA